MTAGTCGGGGGGSLKKKILLLQPIIQASSLVSSVHVNFALMRMLGVYMYISVPMRKNSLKYKRQNVRRFISCAVIITSS